MDAFPSGLAAVVSKCATPAMLDFASALEAQIARLAEASSAPNVVVYEAGSAAPSSADAFDGQLSFLRAAGRAIAAGMRTIVIPEVACHDIAAALLPALPVPVVDVATAVLDSLRASASAVSRVRLLSVAPPVHFSALAARFADEGIELSVAYLASAQTPFLAHAARQAGNSGIQRLWLSDELWHLADLRI